MLLENFTNFENYDLKMTLCKFDSIEENKIDETKELENKKMSL